jgi:transportin-3
MQNVSKNTLLLLTTYSQVYYSIPLLPGLNTLVQKIHLDWDDPDKIRGYCRIFAEAGEAYRPIIIQNFTSFSNIVSAILKCASYDDLEIVKITFTFWFS